MKATNFIARNLVGRFLPVCRRRILLGLLIALLGVAPSPASAQTLEWLQQLGTSSSDRSNGVSADGLGNVYISGWTTGSLGGPNAGSTDAFVSKYNASGTLLWTEQLGTSEWDFSYGVSADGLGNVYISGETTGILGGPNAGGWDAFASKYDASGTLLWTEQLGTSSNDSSGGVSADGLGNVYISGNTYGSLGGSNAGRADAFVSKYDASGTLLWTEQGTSSTDRSTGVSADGLGNVYISGYTQGSLEGPNAGDWDAFVSKYDDAGTLLWTEQLGTSSEDQSWDVSADGLGNVYITGHTEGSLGGPNAGNIDAFVSKYDASGTLLWSEQLGTSSRDFSYGVSADGLGNVYISGTTGNFPGGAGADDAFVSKYDASGTLLWTEQLGTNSDDISWGVSADGLGNVYFSGWTKGSLGGPSAGGRDAFVGKISDIPEPTAVSIDIKPDSDPNSINLGSKGNIPVVIFSTDIFDATTVDPATIMLAGAGVLERGKKGDLMASFEDIDEDGLLDLILHIDTQGLLLSDGDLEAQLTGETFDGLSILGTDAVNLVGQSGGQTADAFTSDDALSAVPEPSTITLLLCGLLSLIYSRRRR